jgi:hypothetical protein
MRKGAQRSNGVMLCRTLGSKRLPRSSFGAGKALAWAVRPRETSTAP